MSTLETLTDEQILAQIEELRNELIRRGSLVPMLGSTSERMQIALQRALDKMSD